MEEITRIFVDTSKQFFQVHGVNAGEEVVLRRKLKRSQFLPFFAKLAPTLDGRDERPAMTEVVGTGGATERWVNGDSLAWGIGPVLLRAPGL